MRSGTSAARFAAQRDMWGNLLRLLRVFDKAVMWGCELAVLGLLWWLCRCMAWYCGSSQQYCRELIRWPQAEVGCDWCIEVRMVWRNVVRLAALSLGVISDLVEQNVEAKVSLYFRPLPIFTRRFVSKVLSAGPISSSLLRRLVLIHGARASLIRSQPKSCILSIVYQSGDPRIGSAACTFFKDHQYIINALSRNA